MQNAIIFRNQNRLFVLKCANFNVQLIEVDDNPVFVALEPLVLFRMIQFN